MKISIQSLSFQPSDKLVTFIESRVGKLSQYSESIMEAIVTLKVDRSSTKHDKVCEIRLAIPGNDLFASKQGYSFEKAIIKTSEALKQQLLRRKDQYKEESINQNTMFKES